MLRNVGTPPHPNPSITPHPRDVRQSTWHNTCYILASLQAIAARHPGHLAGMLTPCERGVRVRHYAINRAVVLNGSSLRFMPSAQKLQYTEVPVDKPLAANGWVAALQRAYLATRGVGVRAVGFPENVLQWALGCRVHTGVLRPGACRAVVLAHLAQMFAAGECVVFFAGKHCWSLVGAAMQAPLDASAWRLTLSDPRGWRRTFTVVSNAADPMRDVYAYSVTMGAASPPCPTPADAAICRA